MRSVRSRTRWTRERVLRRGGRRLGTEGLVDRRLGGRRLGGRRLGAGLGTSVVAMLLVLMYTTELGGTLITLIGCFLCVAGMYKVYQYYLFFR